MPGGWAKGLAAAACFTVAAPAAALQQSASFVEVVAQFEAVAFGHEHGRKPTVLRKWTESPQLGLYVERNYDASEHLPALRHHARAIGRATGLSIGAASGAEDVTLRFGFYPRTALVHLPRATDAQHFQELVTTSACVAMAVADDAGEIREGAIVIGTDISLALQRHCILEELVQVMGLPNDACHYRPSLFCEADHVGELSGYDRLLLRALYDERLEPGMAQDEAMPIARRIIRELLAKSQDRD